MTKFIGENGQTCELDLVKLRHEAKLQEIEAENKAALKLEEARRETALLVEKRREEANLRVENRKGLWLLGTGAAGLLGGILIAVVSHEREMSQREITSTINNKKLFGR